MLSKFLKILLISSIIIFIDQLLKTWLVTYLKTQYGYFLYLNKFFSLVYSWNYGISFGLFNYYQYSNIIFIILNSIIIGYIWYFTLFNAISLIDFYGYSIIIGGALSNLIDRVIRGAVFDFISIHYELYQFPIFNIADSAITIGVVLLIFNFYKSKKKKIV